jgi:hypothetical protein
MINDTNILPKFPGPFEHSGPLVFCPPLASLACDYGKNAKQWFCNHTRILQNDSLYYYGMPASFKRLFIWSWFAETRCEPGWFSCNEINTIHSLSIKIHVVLIFARSLKAGSHIFLWYACDCIIILAAKIPTKLSPSQLSRPTADVTVALEAIGKQMFT